MNRAETKQWVLKIALVMLAATGPLAFPLAQMGYSNLHQLSLVLILPSFSLLLISWILMHRSQLADLAKTLSRGAMAGALATLALEAIRYSGFRMGFMPGNLPELMGVLLLDRFALGPSVGSTLAGFAYHFWNGASFGIIYGLLRGKHSRWWAIPYGIAIGLGFLVSPVVQSLGVGILGRDFGWHFAATVLSAHAAYGAALGALKQE